jgi:RNA polymerase sigma factor (sigma-70 family)
MDLAEVPDEELVRLCREGENRAWSALVHRYERLIITIPRRARLSEQAAADVLQITFTRLYEHLDRIEDPSRVRAWLVTTARRETLRHIEQARREPASQVPVESIADDDNDGALAHDVVSSGWDDGAEQLWHDLHAAVERLDLRCRQLIELLFLTEPEPSYAAIGERLGMPVGSIGPNRGRCLAQLRKLLTR